MVLPVLFRRTYLPVHATHSWAEPTPEPYPGPSTTATFLCDAAGNRVLEPRTAFTVDGETTAYIGGVYQHTDTGASASTYAGSVMRRSGYAGDNGVFTRLGDHLGSTSALVDATGSVVAQQYYYP